MSTAWYQLTTTDVVQQLESNGNQGLTSLEAEKRIELVGPNELIERGGRAWWRILLGQVTDVMTLILIAAALISLFLGDMVDAIVILAIVVLNAALGFSQEYRAEQSMAALKRMSVPKVHVRRDGTVQEISARDLAPGDIVALAALATYVGGLNALSVALSPLLKAFPAAIVSVQIPCPPPTPAVQTMVSAST